MYEMSIKYLRKFTFRIHYILYILLESDFVNLLTSNSISQPPRRPYLIDLMIFFFRSFLKSSRLEWRFCQDFVRDFFLASSWIILYRSLVVFSEPNNDYPRYTSPLPNSIVFFGFFFYTSTNKILLIVNNNLLLNHFKS